MANASEAALERFLARLLRRSTLTHREQAAVLGLSGHAVRTPAHRDIIAPGQTTGSACLVVEGLVARFDQFADGMRQIAALHIPGDMCDLHSVVTPTAGWGLQAMTGTTVLRILHGDLRALAAEHPAIAVAFWRDSVADASSLAKWVSNLGRRDARARTAHLFCEIGVRSEQAGIGSRRDFALPMTQTQLADALGLTSVHVNRTMQAMRRDHLLVTDHRRVRIADWDRLADAAEFDPRFLLIQEPAEPETTAPRVVGAAAG